MTEIMFIVELNSHNPLNISKQNQCTVVLITGAVASRVMTDSGWVGYNV